MTMNATSTAPAANSSPNASEIFVARQPIFNPEGHVQGYELLFRDARQATCCTESTDACTRTMLINSLTHFDLDSLVGAHRAYINITRTTLVEDDYRILPADRVVLELQETIKPDGKVLEAARRLKDSGYMLALDDFVFKPGFEPLMDLADVIKVDFTISNPDECAELVRMHGRRGLVFLAEKVETLKQFQLADRLGYRLVQGYYFKKPQMIEGRQLNSTQRTYLRFLSETSRPEPDLGVLEQILQSDPPLSVKLLRYLNSAGVGLGSKVTSLRHAMALMGVGPLRKWAAMVATSCLGQDKPVELVRLSLARARFCELVCDELRQSDRSVDFFLLGLLSSLDAMLDQPLREVVSLLPLDEQVKRTLLGSDSTLGVLYLLMLACEQGAWSEARILGEMLNLRALRIAEMSNQSQRWADRMLSTAG